jgi:hypothetical protein
MMQYAFMVELVYMSQLHILGPCKAAFRRHQLQQAQRANLFYPYRHFVGLTCHCLGLQIGLIITNLQVERVCATTSHGSTGLKYCSYAGTHARTVKLVVVAGP